MASISIPREFSDGNPLTFAQLSDAFAAVETFLNTTQINDDNIQNSGITGSLKLLNNSVTSQKIANGAISSTQIASAGVLGSNIAANTITGSNLVNGTLSDTQIQAQGISATSILNATLTSTQMASGIGLVPAGAILPFGGTAAPTGWLMCDGTSYLQATYPALYAAIGNAYGTADGSHFNVPDLRGRFLRGVDGGTGRDPDAASRTAMNTGGATGNNVGSVQTDQLKSHTHTFAVSVSAGVGSLPYLNNAPTSSTETTNSTGGNETRPLNAYVNYIVKT